MLNSFAFCLMAGVIFGFLAGLGIGGGSLLMIWLTIVLGVPQEQARTLNLLFFLPTALITCLFRWHQRHLPLKKIAGAIIGGCFSAAVFCFLPVNTEYLKKGFGILLLITGLRELFYRPRKAR